jgi:hypothetical protein
MKFTMVFTNRRRNSVAACCMEVDKILNFCRNTRRKTYFVSYKSGMLSQGHYWYVTYGLYTLSRQRSNNTLCATPVHKIKKSLFEKDKLGNVHIK